MTVAAYLYDALRTPRGRGRPDGALHEVTPVRLATTALDALRERNALDTALVEDIIMGIVGPVGEQGQCLPRIAALAAGWAETVAGVQINRFCGSGLEATNMAAAKIMAGQGDMMVAGGVEAMSRVPILSDGGAWGADPAVALSTHFVPQGISADLIASCWNFSRADLDALAVESHRRAAAAWQAGHFARSVVPVMNHVGEVLLDRDEAVRPATTTEDLAALKPSFAAMGAAGFDSIALQRYPELGSVSPYRRTPMTLSEPTLAPPMAPSTVDMAQIFAAHAERAARIEALRPGNKDRLFDGLTAAGITHVTVTFDGAGDSGQIESIGAWSGENAVEFPATEIAYAALTWDDPEVEMRQLSLEDVVEQLAYDFLSDTHGGWENNDGAWGEFCFDAAARCIHLEFNERFTSSELYAHDF